MGWVVTLSLNFMAHRNSNRSFSFQLSLLTSLHHLPICIRTGTDTGGSVRVPAAFCGILGFRPSHGIISTEGVIPMAQSFDTVGWFARDPVILCQVGRILLQLPTIDPVQPSTIIIPDDCFQLLNIPCDRVTQVLIRSVEKVFDGQVVKHANLGDYITQEVPSLTHFMGKDCDNKKCINIPSLLALSNAFRSLQRCEFRNNHGEWVSTVKPDLAPGISERVWEALRETDEKIDRCHTVRTELRSALSALVEDHGILALPIVADPPPKLQTDSSLLENFRITAFSLLAIAGMSGFCQVSIPLGMHDNLPVAVSLLARHGLDHLLLNLVQALYGTLQEEVGITTKQST